MGITTVTYSSERHKGVIETPGAPRNPNTASQNPGDKGRNHQCEHTCDYRWTGIIEHGEVKECHLKKWAD